MARQDDERNFNEERECGTPVPPENVPSAYGSSVNPLVSYSPSISYNSVSLYNSVSGEQTFIEIKSSFQEIITGLNTLRWYDDKRFLDYLRIRCVVSLNDKSSKDIDAVQQKLNEYIANSKSQSPEQYLGNLVQDLSDSQRLLLSEDGPFSCLGLVPKVKLTPTYYYNSDDEFSQFSDVFLHDVPVSDLLLRDYEGSLTIGRVQDVSAGKRVGDENNRKYVLEKTYMKDVVFKIGAEQQYTNQSINHLSVYMFAYVDTEAYARENDFPAVIPNTIIEAGGGFINPVSLIGGFYIFENDLQTPSRVLNSPNADILNDLRLSEDTNIERFNTILYDSFIRSLQKTVIGRGFADIIKDQNHYSELWLSRAENDNVRYMFAFDMRAYLIQNSKFPFLYLMPDSYKELVRGGSLIQTNENNPDLPDERTKVLDYTMKRRENFQNAYENNNDLATSLRKKPKGPDYYAPEVVLPRPKENASIFLVDNPLERMDNLSSIAFYEGVDDLSKEVESQHVCRYQYNVEFYIKDSSNLLIQRCAEKLRSAEKKVQEIYSMIINSPTGKTIKNTSIEHGVGTLERDSIEEESMPDGLNTSGVGLYNYKTMTRAIPLEFIGVTDNGQLYNAKTILSGQIEAYIECLKFTGVATTISRDAIKNQLLSAINHPDLKGIEQTAKTIQFFAAMLEGVSNDLNPGDRYHEGGKEKSILKTRGFCQRKLVILQSKNFFDNIFDLGKTFKTGYEYLVDGDNGSTEPGLIRISKSQHTNRSREEFYKYFDFLEEDLQTAIADRQVPESTIKGEAPFLPEYSDSSYSFYTPKNILIHGKNKVNQPSYKISDTLRVKYDIDRYGELFSDLISIKNLSKYLGSIYYLPVGEETNNDKNQQTYNSVIDNLLREDCYIDQGFKPSSEDLKPRVYGERTPTNISEQQAYRLLPYLFGGALDRTSITLEYFTNTDNSIKSKSKLDKSNGNDDKIKAPTKEGDLPIKLAFSILGELTLEKDGIESENYEDLMFNSIKNLVISLGLDGSNIKEMIESNLSGYPNQIKSMLVLSCTEDNLSDPLGNGFQVVRAMLDDLDPASDNQLVSQYVLSRFPEIVSTKDPMKTYSKFLAFWMNYKQLIRVEYLSGFDRLDPGHYLRNYRSIGESEMLNNPIFVKTKLPVWKPITTEILQSNPNRNFLCRLMPALENETYAKGLSSAADYFSMPIYNKYFVLEGTVSETVEPTSSEPVEPNGVVGGGLVGGITDNTNTTRGDSTLGGLVGRATDVTNTTRRDNTLGGLIGGTIDNTNTGSGNY